MQVSQDYFRVFDRNLQDCIGADKQYHKSLDFRIFGGNLKVFRSSGKSNYVYSQKYLYMF